MRLLSLIGILGLFFGLAGAVNPSYLGPPYNVQAGPLSEGGCDPRALNISNYYTDAIYMAKKAKTAMTALLHRPAPPLATTMKFYARAASFFFGAWYTGPATDGIHNPPGKRSATRGNLQTALDTYNAILQYADVAAPAGVEKYISCGNKGVAFIKPTDKDPQQAKKYKDNPNDSNWPELNAENKFPHGALWYEYGKGIMALRDGDSQDPTSHICRTVDGRSAAIETRYAWGAMFFCDILFDEDWAFQSAVDLAHYIEAGDPIYDYNQVAAKTFVHELGHLWDSQTLDARGVVTTQPPYLNGPVAAHSETAAYGFEQAMYLAWNYPEVAYRNADNLALFALISWLYNFDDAGHGWDFFTDGTFKAVKIGTW